MDLHEVFNAVLYLLKSGCLWRMLPEGFPKWRTVYSCFAKWTEPNTKRISALDVPHLRRAFFAHLRWAIRIVQRYAAISAFSLSAV
jgi:transposase